MAQFPRGAGYSDLVTGSLLATLYEDERKPSIKAAFGQIARFPPILSAIVAIIIRVIGIPLPEFLLSALNLLGHTSGLMLLILGMALKPSVLKRSLHDFHR